MESHEYDDILALPHHVSKTHPPMPLLSRAAQFAPFAALTGYEAAVAEAGRFTESRLELDEEQDTLLGRQLWELKERERETPEVEIVYFRADERKAGGQYLTVTGRVKKVDEYAACLLLTDGTVIEFRSIYSLESR